MENANLKECLERVQAHTIDTLFHSSSVVLPDSTTLKASQVSLLDHLPEQGHGIGPTTDHLLKDIVPALNGNSLSPNYYGFVTGGITPAARVGECLVSLHDQNVSVHLPDQSLATVVEDKALRLLMDLFQLDHDKWNGLFTTGTTAGNIVGLALGREYVINQAIERVTGDQSKKNTVGAYGILRACRLAGIEDIVVLTTRPHSSLGKAASVLGLGRDSVIDVGGGNDGLSFDFEKLELMMLQRSDKNALIVAVSCGEVNTGFFASDSFETMQNLRILCDRYGAWLHVDGAFGLFARVLNGAPGFEKVSKGAAGVELADSIAGDAHKLMNVPYDCGFLFSRSGNVLAEKVFQNANAAYLKTDKVFTDKIRSPLNVGIENSRRFRGLPIYATLMAYGREGYRDMLIRQIRFSRAIASFLFHHPDFHLLPSSVGSDEARIEQDIFIIVLFRAKDGKLNESLMKRINGTQAMYCSETSWDGSPATRIAVSNWQVDPYRDLGIVKCTLEKVLVEWEVERSN